MSAAAKVFVDAVLAEYKPWSCEMADKPRSVNVSEWRKRMGVSA